MTTTSNDFPFQSFNLYSLNEVDFLEKDMIENKNNLVIGGIYNCEKMYDYETKINQKIRNKFDNNEKDILKLDQILKIINNSISIYFKLLKENIMFRIINTIGLLVYLMVLYVLINKR